MSEGPPAGPDTTGNGEMRAQQRKSANTRARILEGAAALVRREGVSRLTLQRVADEAGVSKGGLLYHFASKEELVTGLLALTLENTSAGLDALHDTTAPGGFARAYLEYVRDPDDHAADSATSIFAAAALAEGQLGQAVSTFEAWQQRLLDDGLDATTALLTRIIGDGLWLIDLFGLAPPTTAQRAAVIEFVLGLIDQAEDRT